MRTLLSCLDLCGHC